VLAPPWDAVRLTVHVLAATVWVGGQLTLAALVPVLRRRDPELPRVAAAAFARVAWPAYGVLVASGIWNVVAVEPAGDRAYQVVLGLKVAVVAASGLTAWAHTRARTTTGLAVYGALTGLTAMSAVLLGVLLAG
jgi:putative copper export protein